MTCIFCVKYDAYLCLPESFILIALRYFLFNVLWYMRECRKKRSIDRTTFSSSIYWVVPNILSPLLQWNSIHLDALLLFSYKALLSTIFCLHFSRGTTLITKEMDSCEVREKRRMEKSLRALLHATHALWRGLTIASFNRLNLPRHKHHNPSVLPPDTLSPFEHSNVILM